MDPTNALGKFSDWSKCSVAIVGNAASILSKRHGLLIDDADVVIRMNRGIPKLPGSQGTRTDILAFSTSRVVEDIYHKFGARHLIWMSPKLREKSAQTNWGDMSFYPLDRWERLHQRLNARPSVGAMTVDLISSLRPKQVSIFGFDFKRTLTNYSEKQHLGPHDFQSEEIFVQGTAAKLGWQLLCDWEPTNNSTQS
ncbi:MULTISPECIES: glycosyltransferase family 29 protein [unclassified Ruegeria]|uniref:glycosyltransferase family 29 protein n=1 Tax=unclassified Ruegeria TaxID=2625375 RepID=UPI0014892108|nr:MULTISPECIES: glycosyltransferase family 29 protein [unclassified Ruegeria]